MAQKTKSSLSKLKRQWHRAVKFAKKSDGRIWLTKGGNSMKKFGMLLFSGLMALCLCGCMVASGTWYAKIDNSKCEENEKDDGSPVDFSGAGGCDYRYSLPAYNEDGTKTDLTFGMDQMPEDGTYVRLKTQMLRGVVNCQIVDENEVPQKALEAMNKMQAASGQ